MGHNGAEVARMLDISRALDGSAVRSRDRTKETDHRSKAQGARNEDSGKAKKEQLSDFLLTPMTEFNGNRFNVDIF